MIGANRPIRRSSYDSKRHQAHRRADWIALRRYGPAAAFFFLSANLRRKSGDTRQTIHRLPLKSLQHPLSLRNGRSEPFFFGQIFLTRSSPFADSMCPR